MSRIAAPFIPIEAGGGQQAQGIASNLAQAALAKAQIDAQAKAQQEAIKSQEKMNKEQLEATASEHQKYQQFQAEQGQKEMDQRNKEFEAQQEYKNKLIEKQDKLIADHKAAKQAHLQLVSQQMKSKAAASTMFNGQRDEIRRKVELNGMALDAAGVELQMVQNNRQMDLGKIKEMMDQVSLHSKQLRDDSTLRSRFGLEQTFLDPKENPGFRGRIEKLYEGAPDASFWSFDSEFDKVGGEALRELVANIKDWAGSDTTVIKTASTDITAFAQAASAKLAAQLVGATGNHDAPGLKNAIQNFILTGAAVHSNLAGGKDDGVSQNSIMKFDQAVGELKKSLPDETIHAIADALGDVEGAYSKVKGGDSSMFRSTKEAKAKVLSTISGISQVLDRHMVDSVSVNKLRDPNDDFAKSLSGWVSARATVAISPEDFQAEMAKHNLKPKEVVQLLEAAKGIMGSKAPAQITENIAALKRQGQKLQFAGEDLRTQEEGFGMWDYADALEKLIPELSKGGE